nr:hypothetical protein [Tanacetum cinerariifolium]
MREGVLFYNGLDVPTRQILDSKGAIQSKTTVDAKVAIQEMVKYSQKWHNRTSRTISTKTSNRLAAIQAQLNNLGREINKVNEKVYDAQIGCKQLKRDQVDDLMPTIKEGKKVEEFRARNDARMVSKIFGYPSDCNYDKKICVNYAYNLKFSYMI